ncbi:hypothetical protein Tco_0000706 [Tanacetum coccineum]
MGASHDLRGDSSSCVPRSLFWRKDLDGDGERGFDYLTFALVSSKAHREGCRASRGRFPYCHYYPIFTSKSLKPQPNTQRRMKLSKNENRVTRVKVNKLPEEWFSGVSKDKDDLEGIIDYLEPTLYDGFIDPDDEAYKQRRNKLLGMPYTEPLSI